MAPPTVRPTCYRSRSGELRLELAANKDQMSHRESVQDLASLFRAKNIVRPVLLLGAGASFSSGVPLAAESVRRLAKRVYAEKVRGGTLLPEHVKLTEWQAWLQSHDWFIKGEDRLAENFPRVVEHLLRPREYRRQLLLELVHPSAEIGPGYRCLSELVMRGLTWTILKTNFDTCLLDALNERRPHIKTLAETNRWPGDLAEFSVFNRTQVVWLHGKAEQYSDRNLLAETQTLDERLVQTLIPLLKDCPLAVIGYRGAEPSITESLLLKHAQDTYDYRNGIYWCVRPGEPLHPNVEALRRALSSNFRCLEITGFDELVFVHQFGAQVVEQLVKSHFRGLE